MAKRKKFITVLVSAIFICVLMATTAFAYNGANSTNWSAHFNAGESKFLATGPIEGQWVAFGLFSPYYATLYVQLFAGTTWATPLTNRVKADCNGEDYLLSYTSSYYYGETASLGASNSGGGGTSMSGNFAF